MSENTNETNRPTHAIFQVIGNGDKATWIRIGAAWLHKDGKGCAMSFNALPFQGRTVMREITTDLENPDNGGQQ